MPENINGKKALYYLDKVPWTRLLWGFFFVALIYFAWWKSYYWSCCFVGNLSDDGDDPSRLINNRGVVDNEDGKTWNLFVNDHFDVGNFILFFLFSRYK